MQMRKIYGFDPRTRMMYFAAILMLTMGGAALAILGLAGVAYSHTYRDGRTAIGVIVMGGVALFAAAAPFQGWLRGGRSRVIVTQDELIYEDNGVPRAIAWSDIVDLSEQSTYLEIGLRDKQGSVTLPTSFENWAELVQEIRQHARVRNPW